MQEGIKWRHGAPLGGRRWRRKATSGVLQRGLDARPGRLKRPARPSETVRKGGWCKGGGEREAPCARDKVEKNININP